MAVPVVWMPSVSTVRSEEGKVSEALTTLATSPLVSNLMVTVRGSPTFMLWEEGDRVKLAAKDSGVWLLIQMTTRIISSNFFIIFTIELVTGRCQRIRSL